MAALPSVEALRQALRQVIDPEAGINIVELGLIYALEVGPDSVRIDLTMTSPACPMGEMLLEDTREAVVALLPPDVELDLQLVWEPPWTPARMSDSARAHFGWDEAS